MTCLGYSRRAGWFALARIVAAASTLLAAEAAQADPCDDIAWTQKAIATGLTGISTRKERALEKLVRPLFGDDACTVDRPVAFSTDYAVNCLYLDGAGTPASPSAQHIYDRLSKTLSGCLTHHNAFKDTATEHLGGEILAQSHVRSYDGRETWSLMLWDKEDPKVQLTASYETDAARANQNATLPEFLQNALAGKECQTMAEMERLARSNFAGVDTQRVRTEWEMKKPLSDASACFVARDGMRGENVIACNWIREDAEHAIWAPKVHAIRLAAVRSCRKGWTESATAFGAKFTSPAGDTIAVEMRSADENSVTGVAVTVKAKP